MSLINGQALLKLPAEMKIETKRKAYEYVYIEEPKEDKWEMIEIKELSLQERIKKASNGDANEKFTLAKFYEWQSRKELLELAKDIGYEGSILAKFFHGHKFLKELAEAAKSGKVEFVNEDSSQVCADKLHVDTDSIINNAVKWFAEAAELGHVNAQSRLLNYYSRLWSAYFENKAAPIMTEDSIKVAIRVLTPMANQGDPYAAMTLGYFYSTFKDVEKAIKYFTCVAEQDKNNAMSSEAADMLAIIYFNGKKEYFVKQALKWIDIAIAKDRTATYLIEFREEIMQKLTELNQSSSESQPVVTAPISSMTQHLMNKTDGRQAPSTEINKEDNDKTFTDNLLNPVFKP